MSTITFERAVVPWANGAHKRRPAEERFWASIRPIEGKSCWGWVGYVGSHNGYGYIGVDRKVYLAHRWSYEHFIGPIPPGLHIDHLCRERRCVRPDHLEAVTQGENNRRAWAAKKANR